MLAPIRRTSARLAGAGALVASLLAAPIHAAATPSVHLAASSLLLGAPGASVASSGPLGDGQIAFARDDTASGLAQEIYQMNIDGTGERDVTNNPANDFSPAWSPDGTKIAFVSDRTGNDDIWIMDAGGTNPVDLTNDPGQDTDPVWSRTGDRIVFTRDRSGSSDIWIETVTGSASGDLTPNTPTSSESQPSVNRQDGRVAFTSNRTGDEEIWALDTQANTLTDISNDPGSDSQATWSPDGTKIAFVSDRTGDDDVYSMNSNGSAQMDLTNRTTEEVRPAWAPDRGSRIVFQSKRDGDDDIHLMRSSDGAYQHPITFNDLSDTMPVWQPLPVGPDNGSPIQHIVVLDMENHSFDNVFGRLCQELGCNGALSGKISTGQTIPLPDATDIVPPVAHGYSAQVTGIDGGKMDAFDLIGMCSSHAIYGCYEQFDPSQVPSMTALARNFTLADNTFESASVGSWGSHLDLATGNLDGFYQAGHHQPRNTKGNGWGCDSFKESLRWQFTPNDVFQQARTCIPRPDGSGVPTYNQPGVDSPTPVPWIPTIMDRLNSAGKTWKIYAPDATTRGYGWAICPTFVECLYDGGAANMHQPHDVIQDAQNGTLANLSLVIPEPSESEHNGNSMMVGENFIANVVNAIMSGPQWNSTAVFVTHDDCGCFYDHVPPPPGLGVRIPMVIVSPFAKAHHIESNLGSFNSILAFTEHTYGLAPMGTSDAGAYDYSDSFDYTQAPLPPTRLATHTIPAWEKRWLAAHPHAGDSMLF